MIHWSVFWITELALSAFSGGLAVSVNSAIAGQVSSVLGAWALGLLVLTPLSWPRGVEVRDSGASSRTGRLHDGLFHSGCMCLGFEGPQQGY
jgi:hypothetical protein